LKLGAIDFIVKGKNDDDVASLLKTIIQVQEARKIRDELARNRMIVKKYRQHFFIILLMVALAAMTVLWLFS
jgi:FixJ family two-component response regulator